MAILASLDREFAFNNPAAPTTTLAPTKPHVDGKDSRYVERWLNCQIYKMDVKFWVIFTGLVRLG